MSKYVIQSKRGAPPLGAYSQGWRAGDFIFVTGSGPVDPATGKIVGETIEQQTDPRRRGQGQRPPQGPQPLPSLQRGVRTQVCQALSRAHHRGQRFERCARHVDRD
jgi:hypothetical protein